ncbi:MAG: HAD family hydrolase [Phycisphaerae bacterium]
MPETPAVIFDLDDTLYPERDYVRSGYNAVGQLLARLTRRDEPFADWLWQRFESGQSAGAFDALSDQFHLHLDRDAISRLVQAYRNHRPQIQPRPGAVQLLDRLRHAGCRLGIISDGFLPAQQLKLDALALADRFDEVIFTETLGREFWKPNPAAFEQIAQRLNTPHAACIYVGDNPAKDFLAPNRLGWLTIQLHLPDQVHAANIPIPEGQPQLLLHSFAQLADSLNL